jgi:flagellin
LTGNFRPVLDRLLIMRISSYCSRPELTAWNNLEDALTQLSLSSVRLATMRRINRGSDDPAGLIAVEQMQVELTALRQAQGNAARAAGVARVADAALSEVGSLLVSIRGNVVAAAGGLGDAEVAARQLEIDAALEAINRIGTVTSYGGHRVLDGSGSPLTSVLSPDVSQTSTLTLPAISTSELGTADGRLRDLASGGSASLGSGSLAQAVEILDAARVQVLNARASVGAFERYTIDSSQRLLGSMEENLASALSTIVDTDVAMESSRLVRSQILVDAAVSALMVAGQRRGLIAGLLAAF